MSLNSTSFAISIDLLILINSTATSITFKIMDQMITEALPIKGYIVQYVVEPQQWNEAKNETWARGKYEKIPTESRRKSS